jgi:hypothetical protein
VPLFILKILFKALVSKIDLHPGLLQDGSSGYLVDRQDRKVQGELTLQQNLIEN